MRLLSITGVLTTILCLGPLDIVSARHLGAREQWTELTSIYARKEPCANIAPDANNDETFPAYAASQRGVPSFLDSIMRNRIIPKHGNTSE